MRFIKVNKRLELSEACITAENFMKNASNLMQLSPYSVSILMFKPVGVNIESFYTPAHE